MDKRHRIAIYLDKEQHRKLKSILALRGVTVTEWFRRQVLKLIRDQEKI
jgi:hypothetical protein